MIKLIPFVFSIAVDAYIESLSCQIVSMSLGIVLWVPVIGWDCIVAGDQPSMPNHFYSYLCVDSHHMNVKVIEVVESRLREMILPLGAAIEFDEEYYLSANPDVAEHVATGQVSSARDHYINSGYFEDRFPRPIRVDERWYLDTYPDVAEAVADGRLASGTQHFGKLGFREGRLPFAGWSLRGSKAGGVRVANAA